LCQRLRVQTVFPFFYAETILSRIYRRLGI